MRAHEGRTALTGEGDLRPRDMTWDELLEKRQDLCRQREAKAEEVEESALLLDTEGAPPLLPAGRPHGIRVAQRQNAPPPPDSAIRVWAAAQAPAAARAGAPRPAARP
jgi:hypothetical protein